MKGKKTSPEMVEKIKLCIASGMSYADTSRLLGIGDTTAYMVMKKINSDPKQKEEFEELKVKKKKEMQEQASKEFDATMKESFERLFNRSVEVIDEAMDKNLVSPRDAITILGTTFDKRQVLQGKTTSNVGIVDYEKLMQEINKGNEY